MNMGPSDLLCFFLEVEKQYNITVSEEDIIKGSFKTINSIAELIYEKSA
jgi:peptide maturation system acyl carrier-related protein